MTTHQINILKVIGPKSSNGKTCLDNTYYVYKHSIAEQYTCVSTTKVNF